MKLSSIYQPASLLLALFLVACQQPLLKPVTSDEVSASMQPATTQKPAFESSFTSPKTLGEETIYHYLVAEISLQRKQLDLAYQHFMLAASLAYDKTAAEKATRIALHQKRTDEALSASSKWIDFDPNSRQARQINAILHLRDNDLQSAEVQFDALLKITGSRGTDGFLVIASLLANERDKQRNLSMMRKLAAKNPYSAQAHYALALVEFEAKQFSQAILSLQNTQTLDPSWDKPYVLRAQILASQGNNQAAATGLEQAVKKFPDNRSLHQAYGRVLVENQQYRQAIEAFQQAYELKPTDLDTLYAVGMLAMQIEDWDTARDTWTRLLTSDNKKRDDANYFLGQIEELNNNPNQAMKYYAAVGKGKTYLEARLRLARLMAKTGQFEQAQAIFREQRVLNSQNAIQIYAAEAQTLKELGQLEQAIELYTTAIEAYPQDMDLRYARGLYAADFGDLDLAIDDFETILTAEPDNADALNALGYTLADQTDRYQEAMDYILQAHQLKPDEPAILDSLGWVLYKLGKYQEALKYLHKAVSANPDAEIAAHLGEVLWMLGNHGQAKEIWNKALTSEPDSKKLKEVMHRLQIL